MREAGGERIEHSSTVVPLSLLRRMIMRMMMRRKNRNTRLSMLVTIRIFMIIISLMVLIETTLSELVR